MPANNKLPLERIAVTLDHTDHGRRETCVSHQSDFSTPLCEVDQLLCNLLLCTRVRGRYFLRNLYAGFCMYRSVGSPESRRSRS